MATAVELSLLLNHLLPAGYVQILVGKYEETLPLLLRKWEDTGSFDRVSLNHGGGAGGLALYSVQNDFKIFTDT